MLPYDSEIFFLVNKSGKPLDGMAAEYPPSGVPYISLYPQEWGSKLLISGKQLPHAFARSENVQETPNALPLTFHSLDQNAAIVAFLTLQHMSSRVATRNLPNYLRPSEVIQTMRRVNEDYTLHILQGRLPFSFVHPYVGPGHQVIDRLVKVTSTRPHISLMTVSGPTATP